MDPQNFRGKTDFFEKLRMKLIISQKILFQNEFFVSRNFCVGDNSEAGKRQFVHKIFTHNFGAPLPPLSPNQQSDGFPLEFVLEEPGPQTDSQTLNQNCEETLLKLQTNRTMNQRAFLGTVQEPPTRTTCLKSTGGTPPICTAVRPPFATLASKLWRKGNAAVHLQVVLQYASYLYRSTPPICIGDTFEKIPGVVGSGKFLSF